MLKMVLVEDESFERRSLIERIDWELIGISVVGEASNGEQGLAAVERCQPDIVLTDVNMPVMNGIEMSRTIRASYPEMRIIFLSAYDDFDYAKNAIDLSVQAYVMKPVNETELLRTVKRVTDGITERKIERRLLRDMQSSYSKSAELARQALVIRMLHDMPVSAEDARKLNVDWLNSQNDSPSLLVSYFAKVDTQRVDERLQTLNDELKKHRRRFVNIIVLPGRLATFYTGGGDEEAAKMGTELRLFFAALGVACTRMEECKGEAQGRTLGERFGGALLQRGKGDPGEAKKPRQSRKQIVSDAEEIIREQYQQPLTLESVAKALHFTPNYVSLLFRTEKQISINRFIMLVRLEKAKEALQTDDGAISEIAIQCGFGSLTYFHTAFKKEFGLTPNEYRSQSAEDQPT